MPNLTGDLSELGVLYGELSVFTGDLSPAQFERIWEQIVERIDSAANPPITIIDDHLDSTSPRPVQNKVIKKELDNVYKVFPTTTVNGEVSETITIEDGADGIPLENLTYEIPPQQDGSGTPSAENPRVFKKIRTIGGLGYTIYDENDRPIEGNSVMISLSSLETLYAGRVDYKEGLVYAYTYYPSYDGEMVIVGPWASSQAEYEPETDPPIGSQVIDLGRVAKEIRITSLARDLLTKCGTRSGKIVYTPMSISGDFSLTYRADPKAYVDLATGLTATQRQALIGLLND